MINPYLLETHKDRLIYDAVINFQFIESTHNYSSKNRGSYTSITTLLKAMNISPDYSKANKKKLEEAVKYGKLIHSEIETYSKLNELGITDEVREFKKWCKLNKINLVASEYMVHNSCLAGTIDLIYQQDGELVISDIKTTSEVHKDSVSWQLSLYRYLLGENIKKATCIHIRPNLYEVIDIPLKTNEECENLINSFLNDEKYNVALMDHKQVLRLFQLQATLEQIESKKKEIEETISKLKEICLSAMDDRGLLKVELIEDDAKLTISKIIPKDREKLDIKQLRKDHPELDLEQYIERVKVSPYIKIS